MSNLEKQLYRLGAKFRNPTLGRRYRFLKETEKWPLSRLKEYQFAACKKFLEFAGEHSPYFKSSFRANNLVPSEMIEIESIGRIPVMTKPELIANCAEVHSVFEFGRLISCETSGTSGEVLTFKRNEGWDSGNRAAAFRGYSWHGVRPWESNIYFWGYNPSRSSRWKTRLLDHLQNRFRVFDYSETSLHNLEMRLSKARYLHGYSSMIYELARTLSRRRRSLEVSNLKMIKGTSEKIYPHYQEAIKRVFGKAMVSEYGAAESGIIAFECKEGSMHLHMEGVYVEEEEDELIVTNFLSYSFPIIRYGLGDYVRFAPPDFRCPCGMAHPVIEEVEGRVGRNIYGKTNKYPSLTLYYVFKNLYFNDNMKLDYQGQQETKGSLTLLIEQRLDEEQKHRVRRELQKYFDNDLDVTIVDDSPVHLRTEKRRDFVALVSE